MRRLVFWVVLLTTVAFFSLGSSDCDSQAQREYNKKIATTERLMSRQPGPQIEFSMDRYLLKERLARFNDPNKMSYLYITFFDGRWIEVTIIGKVASTTKRLTSPENWYSSSSTWGPAPDEMGVYGSSEPAKVGMTTLGTLLEFGGMIGYIYSETPLTFQGMERPITKIQVVLSDAEKQEFRQRLEAIQKEARQ